MLNQQPFNIAINTQRNIIIAMKMNVGFVQLSFSDAIIEAT